MKEPRINVKLSQEDFELEYEGNTLSMLDIVERLDAAYVSDSERRALREKVNDLERSRDFARELAKRKAAESKRLGEELEQANRIIDANRDKTRELAEFKEGNRCFQMKLFNLRTEVGELRADLDNSRATVEALSRKLEHKPVFDHDKFEIVKRDNIIREQDGSLRSKARCVYSLREDLRVERAEVTRLTAELEHANGRGGVQEVKRMAQLIDTLTQQLRDANAFNGKQARKETELKRENERIMRGRLGERDKRTFAEDSLDICRRQLAEERKTKPLFSQRYFRTMQDEREKGRDALAEIQVIANEAREDGNPLWYHVATLLDIEKLAREAQE